MAVTRVRDEQLKLDDVDQQIVEKNATGYRVESATPALEYRSTGQTLPLGLWKWHMVDDRFLLTRNLAGAGDFSSQSSPLEIKFQSGFHLLTVSGSFGFGSPIADPGQDFRLFRKTVDLRLTWRDGVAGLNTLAYVDETISGSAYVVRETPTGDLDGVDVTYVLANTPIAGTEHVYLNGILQDEGGGNDYTISGATITFAAAPVSTDKVRVTYVK